MTGITRARAAEAATTDGQRRIPARDVASAHLDIRLFAGRVELGHTVGDQVRMRWTVPARRPLFGLRTEPRIRIGSTGLSIRCRKARLRLDLPTGMTVRVKLRRGKITSWGADAGLELVTGDGSVACRELRTQYASIRAARVNLHFAAAPNRVQVHSDQAVIALPGGPYFVTAPVGAEVTVPLAPAASAQIPQITVSGRDVRVLAAGTPLSLTSEPGDS